MQPRIVDCANTRPGMRIVGQDAHLRAVVAFRLFAAFGQSHEQQRRGDLLPGRDQHIHLARRRMLLNLMGQGDQAVGLAAHRGDHNHHIVTLVAKARDLLCDLFDPLDAAERSAAKFLHDQGHKSATSA